MISDAVGEHDGSWSSGPAPPRRTGSGSRDRRTPIPAGGDAPILMRKDRGLAEVPLSRRSSSWARSRARETAPLARVFEDAYSPWERNGLSGREIDGRMTGGSGYRTWCRIRNRSSSRGDGHDRARAVAYEDEVRNPDRHRAPVGIDGEWPVKMPSLSMSPGSRPAREFTMAWRGPSGRYREGFR